MSWGASRPGDRDCLTIMRASIIGRGLENPLSIAKLAPNDPDNLIWIKKDVAPAQRAFDVARAFNKPVRKRRWVSRIATSAAQSRYVGAVDQAAARRPDKPLRSLRVSQAKGGLQVF
jgi:hypothetical protein